MLLLIFAATAQASDRPGKVLSANLCTDQLLLFLADPDQIASVSHLALEPNSSYMAEAAKKYPINHSQVEELLAQQPDLIVTGAFTQRSMVELMRKLGYSVEIFTPAANIDEIRNNIRRMAKLLGHDQRGEALIQQMDRRIREATSNLPVKTIPALFYQPRGYTSGKNTLHDEALKLTGWRNISAEQGIVGYNAIDLETVLLAKPEQFFTSAYAPGSTSLGQKQLQHPALKRITAGRPMIDIDFRYWICGGPMIADAIERLAEIRQP
ncbi:MAG: ABC transporter substrate-binding protein [Sedimenticola sp.]